MDPIKELCKYIREQAKARNEVGVSLDYLWFGRSLLRGGKRYISSHLMIVRLNVPRWRARMTVAAWKSISRLPWPERGCVWGRLYQEECKFDTVAIEIIRRLPRVRFLPIFRYPISNERGPARFKFTGGMGMIMPNE